jgi:type I restriction enzyme R subunit
VNDVIKGKLLESDTLRHQAVGNSKEPFANLPDLQTEILNAIIGALDAHNAMSTQALGSEAVRLGLRDVLLNHVGLYEALRLQPATATRPPERAERVGRGARIRHRRRVAFPSARPARTLRK